MLKVRRGKFERRRASLQLRRNLPSAVFTGGSKVTVMARSSGRRAHRITAGMLMCAWLASTARYGAVDVVAEDLY